MANFNWNFDGKSIASNDTPTNQGSKTNYLAKKFGLGALGTLEGITDFLSISLAKIQGKDDVAKRLAGNNITGTLTQEIDKAFNPSGAMKVAGDISSGVGQGVTYIGAGILTGGSALGGAVVGGVSAAGGALSGAYQKTGQVGGKEYGYATLVGATEGILEGVLSPVAGKIATRLTTSVGKSTAKGIVKTVVKEGASEFLEEAIAEYANPFYEKWSGVDKNAQTSLGAPSEQFEGKTRLADILYAGVLGFASGGILSGSSMALNNARAVTVGNKIVKNNSVTGLIESATAMQEYNLTNKVQVEDKAVSALNKKLDKQNKELYDGLSRSLEQYNKQKNKESTISKMYLGNMAGAISYIARNNGVMESYAEVVESADIYRDYINKKGVEYTSQDIIDNKDGIAEQLAVLHFTGKMFADEGIGGVTTTDKANLSDSQIAVARDNASIEEASKFKADYGIDLKTASPSEIRNVLGDFNKSIPANASELTLKDGVAKFDTGETLLTIKQDGENYTLTQVAKSGEITTQQATESELNAILQGYQKPTQEAVQGVDIAEVESLAKEWIAGYSELSLNKRTRINEAIRSGKQFNISDNVLKGACYIIANRNNLSIEFSDKITQNGVWHKQGKNTYAVINAKMEADTIRHTVIHETFHDLNTRKDFKELVNDAYAKSLENDKAEVEERTAQYKEQFPNMSEQAIKEEIAADYFGKELSGEETFSETFSYKYKSLWQRAKIYITNLASKLRGKDSYTHGEVSEVGKLFDSLIKGEQVQSKIDAVPIDESKYSIKTLQDGKRKYVEFDKPNEAIIKGNTKAAMAYYVANYLNNIVRNGKNKYVTTNDGSKLYLTSTSVAKLTTPAKDMTLEQFRRKLRAAVHIAELAKVSVPQKISGNRINIKPDFESKHDYWELAQDGWQYRNSYYLDTDGQYYRVQLSISIDGQIEAIYNIGNMREIEFPSKIIDGNNKGSMPSEESTKTVSTSTIISNSSENSNTFEKKSLEEDKNTQNEPKYSLSKDSNGKALTEAQVEFFKDSKVRDEKGRLLVVYHGTNEDFNVFDSTFIGMASGDSGFFGKGFYFAYSKGEASFYGSKRLISAYLNLKNPFNFQKNMQYYNGMRTLSGNAKDAVMFMNFARQFPEIAKDKTIDVCKQGDNEYTPISLTKFAEEFEKVINTVEFSVQKIESTYGAEWAAFADKQTKKYLDHNGIEHQYTDYEYQAKFYSQEDAEDRLYNAYSYLENNIYSDIDMYSFTRLILDNNEEFTQAIKDKGYDGIIQSENGDEAVAFYPNQIKLTTNLNPTSNEDIRYSLNKYTPKATASAKALIDSNIITNDINAHFWQWHSEAVAGLIDKEMAKLDGRTVTEKLNGISDKIMQEGKFSTKLDEYTKELLAKNKAEYKEIAKYYKQVDLTDIRKSLIKEYGEVDGGNFILFWGNDNGDGMAISEIAEELKAKGIELSGATDKDLFSDLVSKYSKAKLTVNNIVNKKADSLSDIDYLAMKEEVVNTLIKAIDEKVSVDKTKEIVGKKTPIDIARERATLKGQISDGWTSFKNYFVNSFAGCERAIMRGDTKANAETIAQSVRVAQSVGQAMLGNSQYNVFGEITLKNMKESKMGKGLQAIWEPINKKGDAYKTKFQDYLLNYHNIERATLKKAVLDATPAESLAIVEKYDKSHPEFKKMAEEIWAFNRNALRLDLESGLISEKTYNKFVERYPHYIPTYRDMSETQAAGLPIISGKYATALRLTEKRAGGGNITVLPLEYAMALQTMQRIRQGAINKLNNAMYNSAITSGDFTDINLVETESENATLDENANIKHAEISPSTSRVEFFINGEKRVMVVSKQVFAGLNALNNSMSDLDPTTNLLKKANSVFKTMITSANPAFMIRNAVRDIQEALYYSKYPKRFAKNYAKALSEVKNNGELWQLYVAMGGFNSSVFDAKTGKLSAVDKRGYHKVSSDEKLRSLKKGLQLVENTNMTVEQLPRFMEFISSLEAGNTAQRAILESADITCNFGRSGIITKWFNSTLIPFLNPAVQGFDKIARTVYGAKSLKGFAGLALKAALLGILPQMLSSLMYKGDDEYEALSLQTKENYWLFKMGDKFIKLPKGRINAFISSTFLRAEEKKKGGDYDVKGLVDTFIGQLTPVENLSRSFFSPFQDVKNNVTWYGSAIENQYMDKLEPKYRYDEGTSSIAIGIGKVLNVSPKKVHYLLDSYSGVIGDFLLPMTTQKSEKDFISANFTIDPVTQNRWSNDFYDLHEEITYTKTTAQRNGDTEAERTATLQLRYLNKVKSAVGEVYDGITAIQVSDLSNKEKLDQTRVLRATINSMYITALTDIELINEAIIDTNGMEDTDLRYTEITRIVYGAERALREYNKNVYSKAEILSKANINFDTYYNAYFTIKDIESDKDKTGKVIVGSKKRKILSYINTLSLDSNQKTMLMLSYGYSTTNTDKVIRYISRLNLTREEKQALYELCGIK